MGDLLYPIETEGQEPLYDDLTQNYETEKNKLRESNPDFINRLRLPLLNNDPDALK